MVGGEFKSSPHFTSPLRHHTAGRAGCWCVAVVSTTSTFTRVNELIDIAAKPHHGALTTFATNDEPQRRGDSFRLVHHGQCSSETSY